MQMSAADADNGNPNVIGVGGPNETEWAKVRGPVKDQDRVLQSQTHVWLRRIPSAIHPKHLCRYYPRIANRLAVSWGDKTKVEQVFEDLLHDHRGQRKGFSERVRVEIERLERFHQRKLHVNYPPLMIVRHRRPNTDGGNAP